MEQAFSPDGGKTWETNWISEFRRALDANGRVIYGFAVASRAAARAGLKIVRRAISSVSGITQ